MSNTWLITESPFTVATAKAYEGLFTQGSGYLQVRGSLEEHLLEAPQQREPLRRPANVTSEKFPETKVKWGTYLPGVFGRHPLLHWEMVNLPWFLGLAPEIGGEKLDMEASAISEYARTLDLCTALLTRRLVWHTSAGAVVTVTFERFVSAARPGLCVQRLTLAADRAVEVSVRAGIDADVRTNGFDHFSAVALARDGAEGLACAVEIDEQQVQYAVRLHAEAAAWRYAETARTAELHTTVQIPAGGTLTVEKRTAMACSRDVQQIAPAQQLADAASLPYAALFDEHAAVWACYWARADVRIDGDEEAQRAMRVSLYHLLRAQVPGDGRVAIDAKGAAGEAYMGHFYWDTEIYLAPFFLYTDPDRARTLLDFRSNTLDGARANAAAYGYPGARYAWESDNLGRECCANWQYADHEVHVTADVAYGLAHYARAADPAYLHGPAATVLVETARYWLARIDWRTDGTPHLLGVMGPDEYSPLSSDNSYTNRMVAFALALAAEVGEAGGASAEERAAFARAAAGLPIPRSADGALVLQCEEFPRWAEPQFDTFWHDRTKTFAAQVSQERLYRSKCLKQADVLMLMALFPDEFTDDEVRAAWDYYLPYTTHDSSLSPGAHALIATRLGLDDAAWQFWQRSCGLDLDTTHGGAAEGIHIANCGASWQIAVLGFAGLRTAMSTDTLTLIPRLPVTWSALAFSLIWHGAPVAVEITPDACTLTNHGDVSLTANIAGTAIAIPAGKAASVMMAARV